MDAYPLEINDLSFAYDERSVLEAVNLRLMPGEVVGLIGPNGTGKSTLVKLAAGLLRPNDGSVKLFGRAPVDWRRRDLARVLALVPQGAYLPPMFTVWESALLGRAPYLGFLGMARERDRRVTHRSLEWVGIAHLADRLVGELSGGERQRVVLARALAQEPHCLLLDEPTTHLDIHHQVAILSLVRQLAAQEGIAVLTVLHDLNLAATFADRLVLMVGGRVVAQGTPAEVLCYERLATIYGESVAVFPHPDDGDRPAILPRRADCNL